MATSSTNWDNFPTAISCLMDEDRDTSAHFIINSRLDAFCDKFFTWLKEIPDEIQNKISSDGSNQVTLLPKTPSLKSRTRVHLRVIQENDSVDSPTGDAPEVITSHIRQDAEVEESPKGIPKRSCRATSKAASTRQVAIVTDSPKGRPTRSCRNRTTTSSYTASTRKASRLTTKAQAPPPSEQELVCQKEDKVAETGSKLASTASSEIKTGDTASKSKAVSHKGLDEKPDNQSPSVRDRARAYETMLNQKTKSPTAITPTPNTNSASRNFTSATISSLAKSSPKAVVCLKRLSSPRVTKITPKGIGRQSRRSSRRSSRLSKSRSEHSAATPTKPARSKLALVKKYATAAQELMDPVYANLPSPTKSTTKKGKPRSSVDSALSSATSTMSPKSSSCDEEPQNTEEENVEFEKNFVDKRAREEEDMDEGLDMTHTVITEVYDLSADGKEDLVDYEEIQTKTVPLSVQESVSDTQASEDDVDDSSKDDAEIEEGEVVDDDEDDDDDGHHTYTKNSPVEPSPPARTTRTRARVLQTNTSVEIISEKNSPPPRPSVSAASYTELKLSSSSSMEVAADETPVDEEEEQLPRTTRTRTRARLQQETEKSEETGGTRTRKRQHMAESSVRDVSVVSTVQKEVPISPGVDSGMRSTRSRSRLGLQNGADHIPCGAFDEVVAGSPAMKSANGIRCSKKRPVEEYGNSPVPKRSRSCAGLAGPNSTFNTQSILLTSSPRRVQDEEDEDTIESSLLSTVRKLPSQPFTFTSAQKSSFMKRTPAFARTNSKVYSFLGNTTPTQNSSGALSSFLKRNTPKSKTTPLQVSLEQKKQKLQEKENKERERLRRAAETKKQKLEEQKRLRDDRLRKVAEAREKKQREELEHMERINKKFEDHATFKDKMLEEKLRAETEKKELREKKMMEANSRRRQEEEERVRKRVEMEEDAKRQQEWLQRKKEQEDEERKRHLEEEKRKQEERLLKMHEEKAKQKRLEEEKRERLRKERERQLAVEKAERERERERIEKEKRDEKERRLEEQRRHEEQKRAEEQRKLQEIRRAQEQEKIRIMEAAHKRAQEEASRIEREREAKKIELQKLIDHTKSTAALNTSTSTSAKASASSYTITPVKAKVYKPSTDPNNYDIGDKVSDDSTDDDEAPKKKIPEWACGVYLNAALIKQYKSPPDVQSIFRPQLVAPPDLVELFPTSRQRHRFKHRTSSAVWTSPALKK